MAKFSSQSELESPEVHEPTEPTPSLACLPFCYRVVVWRTDGQMDGRTDEWASKTRNAAYKKQTK